MSSVRNALVGITGGIAAYKIPLLVRLLRKNGCAVKVVVTEAAKTLVGVDALRTLSGNPVYLDQNVCQRGLPSGGQGQYDMDHIRLSEWADVFVVCPATANTIAKMACGIADNLLTTLALSIPAEKIIVAPAMNCEMWRNGATQANVETLKRRGIDVLPVEDGELACGVSGPGRMLGIEKIAERVITKSQLQNIRGEVSPQRPPSMLSGKSVLVSSGPTEEPIDPVRVITNKSSGKMGAALARAAMEMGARVTVVSGPAAEPLPDGVEVISVRTAEEMGREMTARFASADICIMAAAVSDYRPVNTSDSKIHRSDSGNIILELTPNPDILAKLGAAKKPEQFLVGFALESGNEDVARAEDKMKRKKCDMMVFNTAAVSLGGDSAGITLLFADGGRESFAVMGKPDSAETILANIAKRAVANG